MTPELWSSEWFSALAAIILIDLVLAGDNALVIGLAARNVPRDMQRKVIVWGTIGAILVRVLLTGAVVWLLKIPGFLLVGGLALVYVGWNLTREDGDGPKIEARRSFRAAVQTIIVADAVMGVDNVLAVGGAAHGSLLLVLIGLAISVPVVVWGSTLVLRMVQRFPAILWIGAGVLGWTAAKMIASEPLINEYLVVHPRLITVLEMGIVGGLVAAPIWRSLSPRARPQFLAVAIMLAWLSAWGWIEDRVGVVFHRFDAWTFSDELIDLVRFVGWIPLVMLACGRLYARSRDGAAAHAGARH
jgi:YjbE family integral membrane protein